MRGHPHTVGGVGCQPGHHVAQASLLHAQHSTAHHMASTHTHDRGGRVVGPRYADKLLRLQERTTARQGKRGQEGRAGSPLTCKWATGMPTSPRDWTGVTTPVMLWIAGPGSVGCAAETTRMENAGGAETGGARTMKATATAVLENTNASPSHTTSPHDPTVTTLLALLGGELPSNDVNPPPERTRTVRAPTAVWRRKSAPQRTGA